MKTTDKIRNQLSDNPLILYMKGSPPADVWILLEGSNCRFAVYVVSSDFE